MLRTVTWLAGSPDLSLGAAAVHLGTWGSVLAVLALVWLCNPYHFMDGIDGIAGSQAVAAGLGVAALLWCAGARIPALGAQIARILEDTLPTR